ncbi:hypothetical protein NX059_005095 [Plenodomus lindquistii]|nr:hypothetical protein NX059_005095 [Plenodomus lindquistii]
MKFVSIIFLLFALFLATATANGGKDFGRKPKPKPRPKHPDTPKDCAFIKSSIQGCVIVERCSTRFDPQDCTNRCEHKYCDANLNWGFNHCKDTC